jgi:hypothetical protein
MAHTVSRLGQANATGDALALFLKKFAGEVLTAFLRKSVMNTRHLVRQLGGGAKTAQFPATWRATAGYVTPGSEVAQSVIKHGERTIGVDYPLVSSNYIAQWDELVNHFDVRSIYSSMQADALANSFDSTVQIVLGLAARGTDIFGNDAPDGLAITNASAGTNGETLASIAFDIAQRFDENDVPSEDRYLFVKPAQYYLLGQTTKVLNRDWNVANGAYAEGTVLKVGGLEIVKTNNVPQTNIASSPAGANNTYHGNFSTTVCLAGHKSAIGTVRLMDVASESAWIIEKQATLLLSKMIVGSGVLRPECAAEVKTA